MELTPQILIVVLPLIFLGGFVDSVAGGGGLITLPAYLMAGIPAHLAMGTNKVVNGTSPTIFEPDGKITREEAVELIKRNTRRYAKRQMTWFRRDRRIAWFEPTHTDEIVRHIEKQIFAD